MEMLERVSDVLRMLAHPHRLKIIEVLEGREDAPVHEIADQIGLTQAPTSQHLNKMRRMGIVDAKRNGKEMRYFISDARSVSILGCIRKRRTNKKGRENS